MGFSLPLEGKQAKEGILYASIVPVSLITPKSCFISLLLRQLYDIFPQGILAHSETLN